MYAKFCVNRETASSFMRLFVNRRAYAIQGDRPLPNGSVPYYPARDWKTKEPKPLDDGVVRMHLNGDITISLYAINPETQRSKWVAIDADFDGALDSLFRLQWELKQDGVDAALEQSRRGGHLWIFGAEPLLASECRIYVYRQFLPRYERCLVRIADFIAPAHKLVHNMDDSGEERSAICPHASLAAPEK